MLTPDQVKDMLDMMPDIPVDTNIIRLCNDYLKLWDKLEDLQASEEAYTWW